MTPIRREVRAIARLALPAIFTHVLSVLMGIVDSMMVARLGTEPLAASVLGAVWVAGTMMVAMGVILGIDPIVSQGHGAGDNLRVGRALQRGLVLAPLLAVPVAAMWLVTAPLLELVRQDPSLAQMAQNYTIAQIFGIAPFLAFIALRQYLAGRGIMAPALWVMVAANLVNVVLNWALIFGHLGFAARGLVGAGIASGLARVFLLVALGGWILFRRLHLPAWTPWTREAVSWSGLREVLKYGLPIGAQYGLEVWGFQVATFLAGGLGAAPLAAHAIVLSLASLTFHVPLGVSIAAATRVGNLTGAGDRAGARRSGFISLGLGAGLMAVSAVGFLVLRYRLPRLWSPAPEVLELCVLLMPIAAAFQVFDGLQVVGGGILRGVGDTRPAVAFNLIGYYALSVPIGWLLAHRLGYGVTGIWWGLTAGLFTVASLLVWRIYHRL